MNGDDSRIIAWDPKGPMRWHAPQILNASRADADQQDWATPLIRLYTSSRQWTGFGIVKGPWRRLILLRDRREPDPGDVIDLQAAWQGLPQEVRDQARRDATFIEYPPDPEPHDHDAAGARVPRGTITLLHPLAPPCTCTDDAPDNRPSNARE